MPWILPHSGHQPPTTITTAQLHCISTVSSPPSSSPPHNHHHHLLLLSLHPHYHTHYQRACLSPSHHHHHQSITASIPTAIPATPNQTTPGPQPRLHDQLQDTSVTTLDLDSFMPAPPQHRLHLPEDCGSTHGILRTEDLLIPPSSLVHWHFPTWLSVAWLSSMWVVPAIMAGDFGKPAVF